MGALAKRTYKNQVTIPKDLLRDMPDVQYFDVTRREGEIVLRPVRIVPTGNTLEVVRRKIAALGLTEKDVEEEIRWVRRHR